MRSTLFGALVALAALAACGGDDAAEPDASTNGDADAAVDAADPDAAIERGSATITGTIAETSFAPVNVFTMVHPAVNVQILVMHEDPAVRCEVASSDEHVIVIGFHCADAEVGTRDVVDVADIDCADAVEDWILVEGFTGEFPEYGALSGQVTIDSVGPTLSGSFDANFGVDDDLAGTFDAVICP